MESPLTDDDAKLASLIAKVSESEEATRPAREKSERDRDYSDGKQLTQDEYNALVRRGQPPIAFNVIRSRVDFHQGLEKKQRRDPKAWPRNNPDDLQAADAFTDGMRYVIEEADYQSIRSAVWRNVTVEGFGGLEAWAEDDGKGSYKIRFGHIPWDRLLIDPYSSKPDFSDANYLGMVLWLDAEEAVARYPDSDPAAVRSIVETTLSPTWVGETYDDKPSATLWADRSRKRVRIITLWCREGDGWTYYEFTRGGMLMSGPSPYVDEDGASYCPLILESCFIDRDNNRYGVVRDLIDPQDEINKRRSKSLHLLTTRGVVADQDAVEDVAAARRQLTKPDFWIQKRAGAELDIITSTDLAAGQTALLQDAMAYVQQSGPNAALLGKGVEDQSGKAIEAQQAGGLIEHGDLLDTLRRLDRRVFRMVAQLIKQFWTAEKWIRVTDDEMSPKWVGLNIPRPVMDPMTGEPMVDPWTGQPITEGMENSVADLDVDIIITDAPDLVTLDSENYQSIAQILGTAGDTPPAILRLMIEMHPALTARRKKQLIDTLEQASQPPEQPPNPQMQQAMELEMADKAAGIEKTRAETERARADAFSTVAGVQQNALAAQYQPQNYAA